MRFLAALFTLAMIAASGWAGHHLWQTWSTPPADMVEMDLAQTVTEGQPEPDAPTRSNRWPALFGTLAPPTPQPPKPPEPAAEPQPPKPPAPPIESLGYTLKGIVRSDTGVWGMVSHPTGERILRKGDTLAEGFTVVRIDDQGVWLDAGADALVQLGFENQEQ